MTHARETTVAATDAVPSPRAAAESADPDGSHEIRASRIGLMSVSLGTAGLGGAWQAAATTHPAALPVSDGLFVLSGLVWLVLLAQYLRHGGARRHNLRHDLRHPEQGFALAYVPLIGMLITGHFSRFGTGWARAGYAVLVVLAALVAARLLAHWISGGLSKAVLHPGYLLPVSSAPFIAGATAATLKLPVISEGAFAVGVLYWLAFGTVVLGSLVIAGPLPHPARPALTVLTIPPATGGIGWMALHRGAVDGVAHGFAGILLFTLLLVALLLPSLRPLSFHPGLWVFSFPVAASTNFAIRLVIGAHVSAEPALTWGLLALATGALGVLAGATVRHGLRRDHDR